LINRLTYEVSVRVDNRPEIVAKNQSILFNLGIDLPIRRMLGLYLHRDTSRRDRGEIEADLPINEMRRDLFQDCYTLLRALVKDNRKAQTALFPYISKFSEHMGIEQLNVADTITEIFKDNIRLCRKVEEKFFDVFISSIKMFGRKAQWLTFFQSFMLIKERR